MRAILATGTGVAAIMLAIGWGHAGAQEAAHGQGTQPTVSGEELFLREWLPNDPRSPAGDGLGPVFNDTSCVACHNLGGIGGGGSSAKNVELMVLTRIPESFQFRHSSEDEHDAESFVDVFDTLFSWLRSAGDESHSGQITPEERVAMARIHPGFRNANSVVLHCSGTEAGYAKWRRAVRLGESIKELEELIETGDPSSSTTGSPSESEESQSSTGPVDDSLLGRLRRGIAESNRTGKCDSIHEPWLAAQGRQLSRVSTAAFEFGQEVIEQMSAPPGHELRLIEVGVATDNPLPSNRSVREIAVEKAIHSFGDSQFFDATSESRDGLPKESRVHRIRRQRNPTALFGIGLIDSIPDAVIEEGARRRHPDFRLVTGRVARLKDGKVGRFGWKGQKATLREFTMTACAVELGLHVPEHPQAPSPTSPERAPVGYDLSEAECDALVEFLRRLPAPKWKADEHSGVADYLAAGRALFQMIGCAECHVSRLGEVEGIYSDLLLHDLGEDLSDQATYGGRGEELKDEPGELVSHGAGTGGTGKRAFRAHADRAADSTEWRTPPLWGVAHSAPYLHDGRANTLEEAILHHGGEAAQSTIAYYSLEPLDRMKVIAFLKTLGVPE